MTMRYNGTWRAFSVPKAGHSDEENEDCFATHQSHRGGGELACLALSDGATEAAMSRDWAKVVVGSTWRCLLEAPSEPSTDVIATHAVDAWLAEAREVFSAAIHGRVLPWYLRAKMSRQGAFATFLGVRLTHGHGRRHWSAVACGDTCVIHVAHGCISSSFPLSSADAFTSRPSLVPSDEAFGTPVLRRRKEQPWQLGDIFVLATDAVAHWILEEAEGNRRLRSLIHCQTIEDFETLVAKERAAGRMKNDDSTAIIFRTA